MTVVKAIRTVRRTTLASREGSCKSVGATHLVEHHALQLEGPFGVEHPGTSDIHETTIAIRTVGDMGSLGSDLHSQCSITVAETHMASLMRTSSGVVVNHSRSFGR